jgi:hypothetical protein
MSFALLRQVVTTAVDPIHCHSHSLLLFGCLAVAASRINCGRGAGSLVDANTYGYRRDPHLRGKLSFVLFAVSPRSLC